MSRDSLSDKDRDLKDDKQTSKVELARMISQLKLERMLNYLIMGFAPVVAILALVVAVFASGGNQSSQAQLVQANARIENLNATLLASHAELGKIKAAIAQDKLMLDEEKKKQEERMLQIVQNVSALQQKFKVSPTLAEQLLLPVNPPVSVGSVASPGSAAGAENKPVERLLPLKKAIEKFNKK